MWLGMSAAHTATNKCAIGGTTQKREVYLSDVVVTWVTIPKTEYGCLAKAAQMGWIRIVAGKLVSREPTEKICIPTMPSDIGLDKRPWHNRLANTRQYARRLSIASHVLGKRGRAKLPQRKNENSTTFMATYLRNEQCGRTKRAGHRNSTSKRCECFIRYGAPSPSRTLDQSRLHALTALALTGLSGFGWRIQRSIQPPCKIMRASELPRVHTCANMAHK